MRKNRSSLPSSFTLPFRHLYTRYSFIVWGTIAVLLIVMTAIFGTGVSQMRLSLAQKLDPILSVITTPVVKISDTVTNMSTLSTLRAENLRLIQENENLQNWYQSALKLQAENKSLRDFLNIPVDVERDYVTARVSFEIGGRFLKSVFIGAGADQGVEIGQAVITPKGLVGRITQTASNLSRALLITDINSRIPVLIEGTRHRAILAGVNENDLTLEHLSKDSGLSVGARIVTSGHDGVLPAGLAIGVVKSITPLQVTVAPFADLKALDFVQAVRVTPRDTDLGL